MLMNKTWLLIPGCWADTQIEPLSSVCQKFSGEVLQRSYNMEQISFSGDNPSNFPPNISDFICSAYFPPFQFTLNIHSSSLYYLEFNWLFLFLNIFSRPLHSLVVTGQTEVCAVVSLVSKWNRTCPPAVKCCLVRMDVLVHLAQQEFVCDNFSDGLNWT